MSPRSRFRGSLLGLAAGDALGTTVEFESPGTFTPLTDIVGGGPFNLQPGQWTDDTSMALCLAESLIECGNFNPLEQLERYCRWHRQGHLSSTGVCFDIGGTTWEALTSFERRRQPYPGSTEDYTAGNGCIMRLAPVPLRFAKDLEAAVHFSGDSSRTTHGATECVDACRYFGSLIATAARGVLKEKLFTPWSGSALSPKIAAIAAGSFREKQPPAIRGTGYVVDSLEAALWAFHHSDDFRTGALLAVNLGDDADTTGAVYGQLAGAFYGEDGVPAEWREKLALRGTIESLADRLYEQSGL